MRKKCEEFKAKDGALFGHEYSHQPGGSCRFYVHPGGCNKPGVPFVCQTDGFKVIPRADQKSDSE
jgi:hypothetical protein